LPWFAEQVWSVEMTLRAPTLQSCRRILFLAFGVFLCLFLVALRSPSESQAQPAAGEAIASPLARAAADCAPDNSGWEAFPHFAGALHEHSGYSDGAPGSKPADYYAQVKARGFAFVGGSEHSDSASVPVTLNEECATFPKLPQCVQPSPQGVAKWEETLAQARAATDGAFTGFRGFEWTSDRFGHINVYLSRHDTNAKVDGGHVEMSAFWSWFTTSPERNGGADGLAVFNHPGREDQFTTREPGFNWNDFAYVPAADARMIGIETFNSGSEYGTNGPNAPAKGWYAHALDKGWHLGPIAGEDEHGTDWGSLALGKTVVIARENSEAALREALLARRFYAVGRNHNDLRLTFTADDQPMGARLSRVPGSTVSFAAAVTAGTFNGGTLELVSNGGEVIATGTGSQLTHAITVAGGERWYFVRVRGQRRKGDRLHESRVGARRWCESALRRMARGRHACA
jgi:hypothetical protein